MLVDSRGARFAAGLSAAVLVVVLASGSAWLALVQAVVYGFTAASPESAPYLAVYRALVAPMLPPPRRGSGQPAAAVRVDALAGLVLVVAAAAGYLLDRPLPAAVAAGAALALAVLHAALGRCPACLVHPARRRAGRSGTAAQ